MLQIRKYLTLILIFALVACGHKQMEDATLYNNAKHEIEKGNYEAAVVMLDTLIERNALNDSAFYRRGIAYSKLGDKENALSDFSHLIKASPTFGIKALRRRGGLYYEMNEFEKSIEDFNNAIKLDSTDFHTFYSRGILKTERKITGKNPEQTLNVNYSEQGNEFYYDYKGALEDFNKAIELDTTFADCYVKRGKVLANLDQNEKALEDFNKAINVDSKFADAFFQRALLYKQGHNTSKAMQDFNAAIELKPTDPFPFMNRGYLKKETNDKTGACEDFRKADSLGLKMTEEDLKYCN